MTTVKVPKRSARKLSNGGRLPRGESGAEPREGGGMQRERAQEPFISDQDDVKLRINKTDFARKGGENKAREKIPVGF